MLKRGDTLIFRKIAGNRIFVCNLLHEKRKTNFLKNCNYIQKVDASSTLGITTELEFVYKYDSAKKIFITGVERDDFILPKWRLPTNKIPFKHVKFEIVDQKIPKNIYKKITKPAEGRSSDKKGDINIEKNIEYKLLTDEEIKIKKDSFSFFEIAIEQKIARNLFNSVMKDFFTILLASYKKELSCYHLII